MTLLLSYSTWQMFARLSRSGRRQGATKEYTLTVALRRCGQFNLQLWCKDRHCGTANLCSNPKSIQFQTTTNKQNFWKVPVSLDHPSFASAEIPHLLEETAHLADEALLRVGGHVTVVLVGEEVVAQDGSVGQRLQDAVHEAGVAQVDQPAQT